MSIAKGYRNYEPHEMPQELINSIAKTIKLNKERYNTWLSKS